MRLKKGEQSLLAYFTDRKDAERAVAFLREAGFATVQLDETSESLGEAPQVRQNPLTGRIPSLGGLTLGADVENRSEGAALAAHPDASGLADVEAPGPSWLVTVVTQEARVGDARRLLRRFGGHV